MDHIEDLFLIETEENIAIFKHILQQVDENDDFLADNNIKTKLIDIIFENPYPAIQIYNLLCRNILKNHHNDIVMYTHKKFCDRISAYDSEDILKELNFLANIENISVDCNYRNDFFNLIHRKIEYLDKKNTYLSLLSCSDFTLLKDYLCFELNNEKYINHKYFINKLFNEIQNCIIIAIKNNIQFLSTSIEDSQLKNILIILKYIYELKENQSIENISIELNAIEVSSLSGIVKIFYLDLLRLKNLIESMKNLQLNCSKIKLKSLIEQNGLLKMFLKRKNYDCDDDKLHFDDIELLLKKNNEYLENICNEYGCDNVEILPITYFNIIKIIFEMIISSSNTTLNFDQQLLTLKILLRKIKNLSLLCSVFNDIFKLIFIRYEHLKKDRLVVNSKENHKRNGYICTSNTLQIILEFLKTVIIKRFHTKEYKISNDIIKSKISVFFEFINDSLWRLSVLVKSLVNHKKDIDVNFKELSTTIKCYSEELTKSSSDDDDHNRNLNKNRKYSNLRRKSRPKKYLQLPDQSDFSTKNHKKDDVCIIGKLLGNHESFAIYSLQNENFNDIKHIIQSYNLQNSNLENELLYLEKLQIQRSRLQVIYQQYQQQKQSGMALSVIDRIKKVAAVGFEVSKTINIIEKFMQISQIEQSVNTQNLFKKFSNINHKYLEQYYGNQLQIVGLMDLILNINFNYEICSNIMNIINRIVNLELWKENIGSTIFFVNVTECMHILKNHNKKCIGLQEMLWDNTYSLKPADLTKELQREKSFFVVFEKTKSEINSLNDLKGLLKYFDDFKKSINYFHHFYNYIKVLSKLLKLHDQNKEYTITELLQHDPEEIIGTLIFAKNMTPLEIENYVIPLNLNLTHVIAKIICQQFSETSSNTNKNILTEQTYNYVMLRNKLIAYLLKKIHQFNNDDADVNDHHEKRFDYLERFVKNDEIFILSKLYQNNIYVTSLLCDNICDEILCEENFSEDEMIKLFDYFDGSKITYWNNEKNMKENLNNVFVIEKMWSISNQADYLCKNYNKINDSQAIKTLIENILLDSTPLQSDVTNHLKKILNDVNIFTKIAIDLNVDHWKEAYDLSFQKANYVVKTIASLQKYQLLFEWSEIIPNSILIQEKKLIFHIILQELLEMNHLSFEYLLKFIEKFPNEDVIQFYGNNVENFRNLQLIKYVVNYLESHSKQFYNIKISLNIFEFMSIDERNLNWKLLNKPLLLIEQYLMNSKFDNLGKILKSVKQQINNLKICKYCSNKNARDIYNLKKTLATNSSTVSGEKSPKEKSTRETNEFTLLNYYYYRHDHNLTIDCIDLLLGIYATKALDYDISDNESHKTFAIQTVDSTSLDSLCDQFFMPKETPSKEHWIRDKDATNCMCCRRSIFSMFIRRHHCRRCGRVICHACSTNRIKIPQLYENVLVRACNDCFEQTQIKENQNNTIKTNKNETEDDDLRNTLQMNNEFKWQLTGNMTYDKFLRDEFSFEYTPSVSMCLSILEFHSNNKKCIDLIMYYCQKFEALLVPNPEVDLAFVAKMINCLALAAKVRGGPPQCDTILYSDFVKSITENGCESLLTTESLREKDVRKLGYSLELLEEWSLSLEVFLKYGFPTTGVMVSHGLSCLKAGCFETAREKFSHCMTAFCSKEDSSIILKCITEKLNVNDTNCNIDVPVIKSKKHSPTLLNEIIKIIETTSNVLHHDETLSRASSIRSWNSINMQKNTNRQHIPKNEPALNILQTLSNLKNISRGDYCRKNGDLDFEILDNRKFIFKESKVFKECFYYILLYGSHLEMINFLMRHDEISCVLKYYYLQKIDNTDIFIQSIYLKFLTIGKVEKLIQNMLEIDDRLLIWRNEIMSICRFLEQKKFFNSLYELQILLKDPIRASMTCVKFYSMNCTTFHELQNNSFYLELAKKHLESELELCQWEDIKFMHKNREDLRENNSSFLIQMDAKTLNTHINTIIRQIEVVKFLAITNKSDEVLRKTRSDNNNIPTLFASSQEKIQLCVMILICGKNVEEGFGLVYQIIHDYKLSVINVYGGTAKYLTENKRINEVEKLLECIKSNSDEKFAEVNDEILKITIDSAKNIDTSLKTTLNQLIKKIQNIEMQIDCHIIIGQLKSAYLLAIQHNRINDVRKILRYAESTNLHHIKILCEKKLKISTK